MPVKTQPGGMFNSYKAQYSPETHKLLKVLMEEVKLTTAMRQKVREAMKRGEPLPAVAGRRRPARPSYVEENLFGMKKNWYFTRRSQDSIINSGAYENERFRYGKESVDLEKEKERLRDIMTYGKNRKKLPPEILSRIEAKKEPVKTFTAEERLGELITEIEERMEFLKDMEAIGQRKTYEQTIKQEIAGKVREMEKLDKSLAEKYRRLCETVGNGKTYIEQSIYNKKL